MIYYRPMCPIEVRVGEGITSVIKVLGPGRDVAIIAQNPRTTVAYAGDVSGKTSINGGADGKIILETTLSQIGHSVESTIPIYEPGEMTLFGRALNEVQKPIVIKRVAR